MPSSSKSSNLYRKPFASPEDAYSSDAAQQQRTSQAWSQQVQLSGWGNYGAVPGIERWSEDLQAASANTILSRGMGRSYGDSSLPPPGELEVLGTRLADRILAFDSHSGIMRAEAGLSLFELNRLFLRQGWFTTTTPGTQFVSLGGMVAADVHGKGHHRFGCFGSSYVRALKMRVGDGRIVECSPAQHADLFRATIGGMGLTGHILEVEFKLDAIPSPWIYSESRRIGEIDEFVTALKQASEQWDFVVGWIDCLSRGAHMGRGILDCGRFASQQESGGQALPFLRRLSVPWMLPSGLLNAWTVHAFNSLYYWRHIPQQKRGLCHPDQFFYPLDALLHWNRIYGRRGFTQYQCVLPAPDEASSARQFLDLLTRKGGASFLCVIKYCGDQGLGLLSFPMRGITIALDIPVRDDTQQLVDTLNEFVIAKGGRIYLAKDSFTRPEHFRAMEPRLAEWSEIRRRWDPELRLRSAQSVRILQDPV